MLYDTELKVLKILWEQGDLRAKELAIQLKESTGWSKTTSYTIFKRCIEKGLIERIGFDFVCRALLTKEEAQHQELVLLTERMFDGSSDQLISSLLGSRQMTASQIVTLRKMVQEFIA